MFITCSYVIHPANPKNTSQPNYSSDPANLVADEVVSLVKNIRNSDLKKCNVILDIRNKDVVKCRSFQMNGKLVTEPNYQSLLEYFQGQYPDQIGALLKAVELIEA